jgi:hypothetical protein
MSDYAWFKLLVRAIGIILIGFSVPTLLWYLTELGLSSVPNSSGWTSRPIGDRLIGLAPVLASSGTQAFMGWYLLFRGEWIIGRVLAEVNGRCAKCGYDIRGLTGEACPECNTPLARANRSEPKTPEPT